MTKTRTTHRCGECGAEAVQWAGRCAECGAWGSLSEVAGAVPVGRSTVDAAAVPLPDVAEGGAAPTATGLDEFDRVLGGGLVPGSVTLLGGEPGIGKSTLALQVAAAVVEAGGTALYVTGEESLTQVRARAERVGAVLDGLLVTAETHVATIEHIAAGVRPDVLVVDSIQTVYPPDSGAAPGSTTAVRDAAHRLVQAAKARSMATILVGQVTKDGALAGPRLLEHVVDSVVDFGGDRSHTLRLLRIPKHRYGSTDDLAVFEMGPDGLTAVADPSALFLADRRPGRPGSAVVPTVEGNRALLIEIQALVAPAGEVPKRSAQGLDSGRLGLLLAVLQKTVGLRMARDDVYALAVGGVRVREPGADLALALAVASAKTGDAVPSGLVACGELGLAGELRQVPAMARRLAEASRLGFTLALVPPTAPEAPPGIDLLRADDLPMALDLAGFGVSWPRSVGHDAVDHRDSR